MNENNEVQRNELDENVAIVLSALNGLMMCRDVCKMGRAVTKINRFKQWVLDLQDNAHGATSAAPAVAEQPTIQFSPEDCPRED